MGRSSDTPAVKFVIDLDRGELSIQGSHLPAVPLGKRKLTLHELNNTVRKLRTASQLFGSNWDGVRTADQIGGLPTPSQANTAKVGA
jgi:hypothetical protein